MNRKLALLLALFVIPLTACGKDDPSEDEIPFLLPIEDQTGRVNQTLRISLSVSNPEERQLSYTFEAPPLPSLDETVQIGGTPVGGEFVWTPIASHAGEHTFVFTVTSDLGTSSETVQISVEASASASAPVFIRPGPGGTYDLSNDPCVAFDIEVRDDDSESVDIRAGSDHPEGSELTTTGAKTATFEWCPTPDQVEASSRWDIVLEADDGEQAPAVLRYVVVLRAPNREGCPGDPPSVTITAPTEGTTVESDIGYEVVATVTDDNGLRDAPILYYSQVEPEDPDNLVLEDFKQVFMDGEGDTYRARVPRLGLEPGETSDVYVFVSATDNDDASGAACDQTTDSAIRSFVATPGSEPMALELCEVCTEVGVCGDNVCARTDDGARCAPTCVSDDDCGDGTCIEGTLADGTTQMICGPVAVECGLVVAMCEDDDLEDNDSFEDAVSAPFPIAATICPSDADFYRVSASAGFELSATLEGFDPILADLDLTLLGPMGNVITSSAGVTGTEVVRTCNDIDRELVVEVRGFMGDSDDYTLTIAEDAAACCMDDEFEDDDSFADARTVSTGEVIEGVICPDDDDYLRFSIAGPSAVSILVAFDSVITDLDVELYGPDNALIDFSEETDMDEEIVTDLGVAGDYTLRILGFQGAFGDYLAQIDTEPLSTCSTDSECPDGTICVGGGCIDSSCTTTEMCGDGRICPVNAAPDTGATCATTCEFNADCRAGDACKWLVEGRGCGDTGSGANGDPCTSFTDCGGQRTCVDSWPGGTCGRVGCATNADCEPSTVCIPVDGQNVCVVDCLASDDLCRLESGYICDLVDDAEGTLQFGCVPGSAP